MRILLSVFMLISAVSTVSAEQPASSASGYDRESWIPKIHAAVPARTAISNVGEFRRPIRKASAEFKPAPPKVDPESARLPDGRIELGKDPVTVTLPVTPEVRRIIDRITENNCPCVTNNGSCPCADEAKQSEPPVTLKPAPTFTPGLNYPPKFTPAPDEWRTFDKNPAYDVFGHEDEAGVFRYTTSRMKAGYARPPAYATPAPTYAAPVYQGYSAGSSCAGGSCAQPQGFNFFRGR